MPRFPFPRSVAADLRDQYKADRLEAQTNHLGYTSLGPDDGSAEVRDENDNVLAHFGHAAGKAGFLVPNGSGWQTIQEHVAASTAALGARVTTAEGRLDAHASRLGAVEGRATTLEGRADSHATRIGAAENDIDSLESTKVGMSTHNALAGRVGAAEGRLDSHASRIGATENVNAAQTSRINNVIDYETSTRALLKSNVDALWDRINSGSGTKPIFPSDPPPSKG